MKLISRLFGGRNTRIMSARAGLFALVVVIAPSHALADGRAYSREIDLAKSFILSEPNRALEHAKLAESLAGPPRDAAARIRLACSQWLEAEALIRLNRADEWLLIAKTARVSA